MKILIFDTEMEIDNISDVLDIINLVFSEDMFIQNLFNNNNWTGENVSKILNTIKEYIFELKF